MGRYNMYYLKSQYNFVKFERSHLKDKKYNAILYNKKSKRQVKVPFGATGYEIYKDTTGLGLYSKLNHNDTKRKKSYIARHKGFIKDGYWSPGYFSMNFLWN
jgi:hypothetical protein